MAYLFLTMVYLILAIFKRDKRSQFDSIIITILLIVSIIIFGIRYGHGTDYFSYKQYYFWAMPSYKDTLNSLSFFEPGYILLMCIFKYLNLNYYVFVFFISIIFFVGNYCVIKRFSRNRYISLAVFISLYSISYGTNIIRQGLVISLAMYASFKYLDKQYVTIRDVIKFSIIILFASYIHSSILICYIFIFIRYIYKFISIRVLNCCLIISFVSFILKIDIIVKQFIGIKGINQNSSFISIASRFVLLIFILYMWKLNKSNIKYEYMIKVYYIGYIIYIFLSNDSELASRIMVYFKCIDILLISNLIIENVYRIRQKNYGMLLFYIMFMYCIGMLLGDISMFSYTTIFSNVL